MVRNVRDVLRPRGRCLPRYNRLGAEVILCCHSHRASPCITNTDLGSNNSALTSWVRMHLKSITTGSSREIPNTSSPKNSRSRCGLMPVSVWDSKSNPISNWDPELFVVLKFKESNMKYWVDKPSNFLQLSALPFSPYFRQTSTLSSHIIVDDALLKLHCRHVALLLQARQRRQGGLRHPVPWRRKPQ